jgi:hypothetical protein
MRSYHFEIKGQRSRVAGLVQEALRQLRVPRYPRIVDDFESIGMTTTGTQEEAARARDARAEASIKERLPLARLKFFRKDGANALNRFREFSVPAFSRLVRKLSLSKKRDDVYPRNQEAFVVGDAGRGARGKLRVRLPGSFS